MLVSVVRLERAVMGMGVSSLLCGCGPIRYSYKQAHKAKVGPSWLKPTQGADQ